MAHIDDTSYASTLTIGALRRARRMIDAYGMHATSPVPIQVIAGRLGWTIECRGHIAPVYGMTTGDGGERKIVVNADICPTWQRYIIAQMLGHWIAGHLNDEFERTWDIWSSDSAEDAEASYIAALLLIPESALREDGTLASIACVCDVPVELVYQRLDF